MLKQSKTEDPKNKIYIGICIGLAAAFILNAFVNYLLSQ